jgi:hypothetical protein
MHRISTIFALLSMFMLLPALVLAQRTVVIEPTAFGILNDTIDGDTTGTGERVDVNTVYVLKRGQDSYYVLSRSIENRFPLTIIAEEGTGERPKIVPGIVEGGSFRPFRPRDDLNLKGLYVSGRDQDGGIQKNMFRVSAEGAKIHIEDCQLDYDGQSAFRLDDSGISVFLTNTVVSNIGETLSMDNGRIIDTRGNATDSLVAKNCTFYNITSRAVRDGGGTIMYVSFDHCTFSNFGQHAISFGQTVEGIFTNNLLINCQYLGNSTGTLVPNSWVGVDSLADSALAANHTQHFTISNNNFYLDPAMVAAYPDTVVAGPFFNAFAQKLVDEAGTGNTMLNEAITFEDGPALPTDVMQAIWALNPEPPVMDNGGMPDFGNAGYGVVPFDFAYSVSAASYTAGMDGEPLGDLNWFGMATSVENAGLNTLPSAFRLIGNYPNPFNPSTNIRFDLNKPAIVTITVYDNLGRKVMSTQPEKMNAGNSQVINLNAGRLATGMYTYKINANTGSASYVGYGRMLLLK